MSKRNLATVTFSHYDAWSLCFLVPRSNVSNRLLQGGIMAESAEVIYEKGKLYHLPIANFQHDPDQPRKYVDEQALNELMVSIKKHGVLEPVLFRKGTDGGAMLVSGERRCQAAKLEGWRDIPAVYTDGDPMEISIVENLLRENLTAIEEAEAIDRLKTQHNYELSDLSATLGKSVPILSEILSLNRLPDDVKNDCRNDPKVVRGILVEIARKKTPHRWPPCTRNTRKVA